WRSSEQLRVSRHAPQSLNLGEASLALTQKTSSMTFDSFFGIIVDSARQRGYSAFLPSLCSLEDDTIVMKVLDGDISEDEDEQLAIEWATNFRREGRTVFLAYRRGNCTVRVQEFFGSELIAEKQFILDPYVS